MKKLTIGMVTYDDFDGVYFSIQAIRMFHTEIINDIEFIIIDNNPNEAHGAAVKGFTNWVTDCPIKYIPFTEYKSTAIRSKIFEHATTPYVLVMDCHVMFESGAIKKLIDYFDSGKDNGNLLQGPMVYDDLKNFSTHFDLVWRAQMWGTWGTDQRAKDPNAEPFEIPAQGLGCFASRKDTWLGFNPKFRGFGGEEGYIHEKYRKAGKKALCLPFLRWVHRFGRPNGVKYPLLMELKMKNYFIGFEELGIDPTQIYDHFLAETKTSRETMEKWHSEVTIKKKNNEILTTTTIPNNTGYVTCHIAGGLGNQMFMIANALSRAVDNQLQCFIPRSFGRADETRHTMFKTFNFIDEIPSTSIINPETPDKNKISAYSGYFQDEKYFKKYSEYIKSVFSPSKDFVNTMLEKIPKLNGKNITAIHVRRGDYLNHKNIHPTLSVEYIEAAAKLIDNTDTYFIFSDDIPWCKENIKFKNSFIVEEEIKGLKAHEILWTMSMCHNFIISNSSFSWWGAYLSKNPNKKVIGPETWFGPDYSSKDNYFCDGWVKLPTYFDNGLIKPKTI